MSWLQNLTDPANASKSFTGILKNLEAKLDAVLDMPISAPAPLTSLSNIASQQLLQPPTHEINSDTRESDSHKPSVVVQKTLTPAVSAAPTAPLESAQVSTEITAVTTRKEPNTEEKPQQDITKDDPKEDQDIHELLKELKKSQELVVELRKEGEELAKKEGLGRETLKKFKSKELENARVVKDLNRRIQEKEEEIQELKKMRDKLLELEKKQNDSIRNLNEYNQEISRKLKISQSELENVQKELLELKKEQLVGDTIKNKDYEKLLQEFQELKRDSEEKERELKQELNEIRSTLANKLKETGWKEDQFQNEIASLNLKLQKSESRMEDLTTIRQEATKPLLRQIDSLQAQYNSSLKDWESLEKSMANRVKDAEISRAQSVENTRILKEENQELLIQLKNLENLGSHLKNDKSRLEFELNELKNTLEAEKENLLKETTASVLLKKKHEMEMEHIKSVLELKFKKQLESEKRSWLEDKEAEIARIKAAQVIETPRRNSVSQRSTDSGVKENRQFEINKSNVIMIERLQLSIKQLEAMVESLQTQLSFITKTRDDLADELYKLSTQNEDLKAANRELDVIKKDKVTLEEKLMACAELIGEREETILELKADINEMRQVYQSQVEELCSKIKE